MTWRLPGQGAKLRSPLPAPAKPAPPLFGELRLAYAHCMPTMADLDELALALPQVTKEIDDGRPAYRVHGKAFCLQRLAPAGRGRSRDRRAARRRAHVPRCRPRREGAAALRRPRDLLHDAALQRLSRGAGADPEPRAPRPRRAARPRRRGLADAGTEARR